MLTLFVKELPTSLDSCIKLLTIDASANQLTSLPDVAWGQLTTLTHINVCDNQLCEVSYKLTECRKLRELLLERNPLKDNRLRKLATDSRPGPALINYLMKIKKTGRDCSSAGDRKKGGRVQPAKLEQVEASIAKLEVAEPPAVKIADDFDCEVSSAPI